jgi:hypothetical protein
MWKADRLQRVDITCSLNKKQPFASIIMVTADNRLLAGVMLVSRR